MKKQWKLVLTAMLFAGSPLFADSSTAAPDKVLLDGQKVTLANYAKVFIGAGNIKLELAPYKILSHEGAIIVFHGIEGDWDGKALNCTLKDEGYGSSSYETTYNGKTFHPLKISQGDTSKVYSLFVPGTMDPISLVPSDGAAQLTSPKAIYDQYIQQHTKS